MGYAQTVPSVILSMDKGNHPFVDGNKRTAFTATELFLALNGQELIADDPSCVVTMLRLAEGSLSEKEFEDWIRANTKPIGLTAI